MRPLPLIQLTAAAAALCALALAPGCAKDPPPMAGVNYLPAVRVWATIDRTATPIRVDIAWQGTDIDGTVVGYLYGFVPVWGMGGCGEHWNPVRAADRRYARFTTRTDTTIWLGGPEGLADAGDGADRYLFVITAVDNAGGIGPRPQCVPLTPAPTFEKPLTRFTLHIDDENRTFVPDAPPDTIGMFRPFAVSYRASTINGAIARYRWRVLTRHGFYLPGEGEWSDDIADTVRVFNDPDRRFEPGLFRLVVDAMDEIGLQQREQGGAVASSDTFRLAMNFPPSTRIVALENRYWTDDTHWGIREIDFRDSAPDTVAAGSWVRMSYTGSEDARDIPWPERGGISLFQVRYRRSSSRIPFSEDASPWLDNYNPAMANTPMDSNSFNVGSLEYEFSARAVDGPGTPDPCGASVFVVGNFNPSLTGFHIEDADGRTLDADGDTVTWNWWKPVNEDTIDASFDPPLRKKTFRFTLHATGHDDPRDPPGSAIKAWRYFVRTDDGTSWPVGKAGDFWFDTAQPDGLDDPVEVTFYTDIADVRGDAIFENLPGYVNRDVAVRVRGRDTHTDWLEPEFPQYVILGGTWWLRNLFASESYGRWTDEREVRFHLRMSR